MGELYTNCNWPNSLLPLIKPALQQREQVSLSEFKGNSVGVDRHDIADSRPWIHAQAVFSLHLSLHVTCALFGPGM
jgi:hypothetical protein